MTKSLGLSKLLYIGGIHGIDPKDRKKIDLTLAKCIWKSGRDRMNRILAKKDLDQGGIKWTGSEEIGPSLNLKWLSKVISNQTIVGQMLNKQLMELAGHGILNDKIDKNFINRTTDQHLKEILNDWNKLCDSKLEKRDPLDLNVYHLQNSKKQ